MLKPLNNKRLWLAFLLFVFLTAGVTLAKLGSNRTSHQEKLKFSLQAEKSDLNGIEKKTAFVLKTNKRLSDGEIKDYLKFNPPVEYQIKSASNGFLNLAKSFLADVRSVPAENQYEIVPQADLAEDTVYKIETATSSKADLDHDYSWAFQVKGEFGIKDSLPADKATGVPVNTGIEITFNRLAIAADAEKYFAIEPATKGRLEVGVNKITFIPEKDLAEKTLYKVTIKKGYRSGEKQEVLAEDKTVSFETNQLDPASVLPILSWNSDYSEMNPSKEGFLEANGNASNSEVAVLKYASADDFLNDYYRYSQRAYNWANFNQEKFSPKENLQQVFKFKPELLKRDENNTYGLIKLPQKLEPGSYLLEATSGESVRYAFVRVSPLAYYYSEINGDGLIWAYDIAGKKPFSGVKVYFLDKEKKEKELGVTDDNGLIKFDASSDKETNENISLVFKNDQLVETAVPDIGRMFQQRKNYFQGYLNTDRYAYRLTDKLHFWGVVKGRNLDLRQKKVKVSLDGYTQQEVMVSPFDTIEGELEFAGLPSGFHYLTVTYNEETVTQASIEVFAFQKPLYKIEVSTDKSFSVTDQPVKAKIKVNFFDGTPVGNMDLNYTVNWREEQKGTVRTNEKGEAEVNYTPKYYFEQTSDQNSDSWTSYPMTLRFEVRPSLSEEGDIWGESYVSIYGPKINLQADETEKGNSIIFKVKANQLNLATSSEEGIIGKPLAGQAVKAQVVRFYYEQIADGETYDPIEKVKVKNYHYEAKRQVIKDAQGTTDQKGEWSITVDKKELKGNGYLKAIFSAEDDSGKKVMSSAESYNYFPGNSNSFLSFSNVDLEQKDQTDYKIGDSIHLKATLSGEDKSIDERMLVFRYQEGLRGASLVKGDDYIDKFEENYIPSMSYTAVRVMPNGFLESNGVTASFGEQQRKLKIDIKADKEKYRPRDEINLDVSIQDKDGKPTKAVANLAAVDEALFNITPWGYGANILDSFYSDIIAFPYSLSTGYVSNFKSGAEKGGCFTSGTKISMADGTKKNIEEIRVGDEIQTFAAGNSNTKASSIVQGVSSHDVNGYLLINGILKVTPEHKINLNGQWRLAGESKIGDYLIDEQHHSRVIDSIKYIKGKNVKVYNIVVDHYHTYFADGFYVHNAEKGGGGDARNFFEDTPLYKQYQSDDNGKIKASFQAPDNLTSWRVSVNAYDPEKLQLGNGDKLVPVGLPLFVDAVVAKQYLLGDNPVIKIRLFGDGYKQDQPIEYELKSDSLKFIYSTTTLATEINVPLGKLPAGKHKLVISAKQGDLKDALEKNFAVYANYVKSYKSDSQYIDNGNSNLKANAGGFTDVLFSDGGKGKYFDELLSLYWQSSIRSDIQTAAYLAAKSLNDNFYNGKENFSADLDLKDYRSSGNNGADALALFPYGGADFGLTAELSDAVADKFDVGAIASGLNTKLNEKSAEQEELGKILYGLSALGQPNLPFINYLKANASTTPETKIYLALAMDKAGDAEGARALYDGLLPQLKTNDGVAYLELTGDKTRNIKDTAIFGILASYLEPADSQTVNKLLAYLKSNPPADNSIALEKAMILKNEIAKQTPVDASLSYQTENRNGKIDLSKGQTYQLTLSENELKSLVFSEVKGKPLAVSYYEEPAEPAELARSNQLSVTRKYLINDKETDDLKDGDLVLVRLDPQFSKDAPDGSYQLVDYLPSGLKPVIREYTPDIQPYADCNPIWYPSRITDDAIYFSMGKWFERSSNCQHRTINFHARVISKGEFKDQGAMLQSLDNLQISNISQEKIIKIR